MAHDSLPELELANVRTRERITDTVERIRHKVDLPARTRLAVAKTKQRWHRDPTPLVALGTIAAAGIAAVVIGARIGRSPAGHLAAPPARTGFAVLTPLATGNGDDSRKARKARQAALEQDPGYRLRKKQRRGTVLVQRQANKYRKQAAKRAKGN